jgi:fucose permease
LRFQKGLSLSKAQSAWVQFAHYLGYFLISLPAGWLASGLGYKVGTIAGLLIVATGGLWFIPATHINAMVHLAQSCNGLGLILGPIVGSIYFYSKDALGHSTGSQTLYIPYAGVTIVVTVLAAVFYFAYIPDIKAVDDYHLDDASPGASHSIWSHPHFRDGCGGAGLLKKFAAHKILGLYGAINVATTLLVFCKLGWLSVACVFLSYFFMSITFPTICHGDHGWGDPAQIDGSRGG